MSCSFAFLLGIFRLVFLYNMIVSWRFVRALSPILDSNSIE